MEAYDTVPADSLEDSDIGAIISIDGEPVEIKAILETEDPDEVTLRVYSHETNETETVSLPYDYNVDLLGA